MYLDRPQMTAFVHECLATKSCNIRFCHKSVTELVKVSPDTVRIEKDRNWNTVSEYHATVAPRAIGAPRRDGVTQIDIAYTEHEQILKQHSKAAGKNVIDVLQKIAVDPKEPNAGKADNNRYIGRRNS